MTPTLAPSATPSATPVVVTTTSTDNDNDDVVELPLYAFFIELDQAVPEVQLRMALETYLETTMMLDVDNAGDRITLQGTPEFTKDSEFQFSGTVTLHNSDSITGSGVSLQSLVLIREKMALLDGVPLETALNKDISSVKNSNSPLEILSLDIIDPTNSNNSDNNENAVPLSDIFLMTINPSFPVLP
jgi:hypothetical protein